MEFIQSNSIYIKADKIVIDSNRFRSLLKIWVKQLQSNHQIITFLIDIEFLF